MNFHLSVTTCSSMFSFGVSFGGPWCACAHVCVGGCAGGGAAAGRCASTEVALQRADRAPRDVDLFLQHATIAITGAHRVCASARKTARKRSQFEKESYGREKEKEKDREREREREKRTREIACAHVTRGGGGGGFDNGNACWCQSPVGGYVGSS